MQQITTVCLACSKNLQSVWHAANNSNNYSLFGKQQVTAVCLACSKKLQSVWHAANNYSLFGMQQKTLGQELHNQDRCLTLEPASSLRPKMPQLPERHAAESKQALERTLWKKGMAWPTGKVPFCACVIFKSVLWCCIV
jgi:hypothetical protein